MKIKTSELIGAALDWAVAKADGWAFGDWHQNDGDWQVWAEKVDSEGRGPAGYFPGDSRLHFSTNWSQGGPIIEREKIAVGWVVSNYRSITGCWSAHIPGGNGKLFYAPTFLIAAMRCFVASKLGDEVDVPEELLK